MYCDAELYANQAQDGSWLCCQCLHDRFGPKHQTYMLPDCLIREVKRFLPEDEFDFILKSQDDFYFVNQYFSKSIEWRGSYFRFALTFAKSMEILRFLATCCGKNAKFWFQIEGRHAIEQLLCVSATDIVDLFDTKFLNSIRQEDWVLMVKRAKTDESAWWLLNHTNIPFTPNNGKNWIVRCLFASSRHWKSERICKLLLEKGFVTENSMIDCLRTIAESNMSFALFELFWNQQDSLLKSEFFEKHIDLLFGALYACNVDVLHFLANLPKFAFGVCEGLVVSYLNHPVLRSWIKHHRLSHSGFWKHDKFYELLDDVILELIADVLEAQPESQRVETILRTQLLSNLIKKSKFKVLESLLHAYDIHTFGNEKTCCDIIVELCSQTNFLWLIHYWDKKLLVPCVTNACLCTWVRKACFAKDWTLVTWLLNTFNAQSTNTQHICDTHDGEETATINYFLKLVRHVNFELASRLFRAAITFGMLRLAKRDFLAGHSLEIVLWFADLHDCNNEQMRIRDVRADKNLLLRTTHRNADNPMLEWIWLFKDNYGCFLKPGDLRDLRRG